MPTNSFALSRLLIAERPSLLRLARRIVGNTPAAEDVTQTVWLRIQRVADEPAIADKRGFLYRLVLNLAADQRRAAVRQARLFETGAVPQDVASQEPTAEAVILGRDQMARMVAAIEELPPRCREVFVMRKIDGLSPSEISRRLGITPNMVAKHVRIALQHCLARLEDEDAQG